MARLPSRIVATGLLRAAEAAGGNGTVLIKGDPGDGAVVLILTCRGADPVLMERSWDVRGELRWNQHKPGESLDFERVAQLVDEKKRFDRDLWVLELDIPNVEQFIVDSLAQT